MHKQINQELNHTHNSRRIVDRLFSCSDPLLLIGTVIMAGTGRHGGNCKRMHGGATCNSSEPLRPVAVDAAHLLAAEELQASGLGFALPGRVRIRRERCGSRSIDAAPDRERPGGRCRAPPRRRLGHLRVAHICTRSNARGGESDQGAMGAPFTRSRRSRARRTCRGQGVGVAARVPVVAGPLVPELEAHLAGAGEVGRDRHRAPAAVGGRRQRGQLAPPCARGQGQRRAQLSVPVRERAPVLVRAPAARLELLAQPRLVEHLLRRLPDDLRPRTRLLLLLLALLGARRGTVMRGLGPHRRRPRGQQDHWRSLPMARVTGGGGVALLLRHSPDQRPPRNPTA
jgi:hypothetical protein